MEICGLFSQKCQVRRENGGNKQTVAVLCDRFFFGSGAMETGLCARVVYVWGAGSQPPFVVMASGKTGGGMGHRDRDSICACVKVRGLTM